ncbi:MAG: hypothetical protein H6767_01435 [Candidatus Peribacteria bacterium]|nr:MAG: hypothetical protein H6767_01435 [Candidatus Peribacteria bacterium]
MSGLIHTDVLKVNHYLYRKNYTRKQKITMMDFLVNFEQPEEDFPGVQEGERILSFRDRLLRLHTEYSLQSVSHFLYHAVEET